MPWTLNLKHCDQQSEQSMPQHAETSERDAARNTVILHRYCHMFAEGELEGLANQLQGLRTVASGYDKGNWYLQLERTIHQVRVKT